MVDPMLEAARAHTKEPEEVDWERRFEGALKIIDYWHGRSSDRMHALEDAKMENQRLKDVILRLEQRCAKFEGRYPTDMVVKFSESEREKWLRGEWLDNIAPDGLVTCNDCGKLLYRSAKDLHKCEGR